MLSTAEFLVPSLGVLLCSLALDQAVLPLLLTCHLSFEVLSLLHVSCSASVPLSFD